jgi:hypothetical protein
MKIMQKIVVALFILALPSLLIMFFVHFGHSFQKFPPSIERRHRSSVCKIMIHVVTERQHFAERTGIRLTWGIEAHNLGMDVRFIMGKGTTDSDDRTWISQALEEEQKIHHDLIQITSPGRGARNLPFVIAGGLKTYVESESTCRYFMKVDHGIYLQPSKLLAVLERAENKTKMNLRLDGGGGGDEGRSRRRSNMMMYMGHMWLKGRVIRDKTSQWYITGGVIERMGKGTKYYPPYASGRAYLLSAELAKSLIFDLEVVGNARGNGCFSPSRVNAGPEDAQLGMCIDQILKTSDADIMFIRSKAFNINHCDEQSVVFDITDSSSALFGQAIDSSVLFHAHAVHLDGDTLCTTIHSYKTNKLALKIPHILVAVTSSLKSFEARAKSIIRTWGSPTNLQQAHAIVRFFVGEDAESKILEICDRIGIEHDMVIALPGVADNEYPPVLKNTAMLVTMHMLMTATNDYDWILKVDDDTLVNFPGLTFLSKFNPLRQNLYLGQKGWGIPADRGKMGIVKPFCMGGPGYVISRAALHILGPKLKQCAAQKMSRKDNSWHSDVIVGLCMYEHVHIGCWDHDASTVVQYQPKKRFFHKYDFLNWPSGVALTREATLHPLKDPTFMRETYQKLVLASSI